MSGFRIHITNLAEGIHHRSLEGEPEDIGLDSRFSGIVLVRATLEKTGRQLLLHAEFVTVGSFACDRCLDEFSREISGRYSLMYMMDERTPAGLEEHEVQFISPEASTIDLGEDVRQFVILAIPQKLLCKENCAGLCPVCGANRNRVACSCRVTEIDPRWDVLKKLLEN